MAAASAVAAASGVAVIAAAFTVYALFREVLGPAGAAAATTGCAALLAALAALVLVLMARPPRRRKEDSLAVRAMDFAREKPLIALGGAAIAGLLAVRNPQIITTAVTAFLAGKSAPKK